MRKREKEGVERQKEKQVGDSSPLTTQRPWLLRLSRDRAARQHREERRRLAPAPEAEERRRLGCWWLKGEEDEDDGEVVGIGDGGEGRSWGRR